MYAISFFPPLPSPKLNRTRHFNEIGTHTYTWRRRKESSTRKRGRQRKAPPLPPHRLHRLNMPTYIIHLQEPAACLSSSRRTAACLRFHVMSPDPKPPMHIQHSYRSLRTRSSRTRSPPRAWQEPGMRVCVRAKKRRRSSPMDSSTQPPSHPQSSPPPPPLSQSSSHGERGGEFVSSHEKAESHNTVFCRHPFFFFFFFLLYPSNLCWALRRKSKSRAPLLFLRPSIDYSCPLSLFFLTPSAWVAFGFAMGRVSVILENVIIRSSTPMRETTHSKAAHEAPQCTCLSCLLFGCVPASSSRTQPPGKAAALLVPKGV